jgi:hypothetical protein
MPLDISASYERPEPTSEEVIMVRVPISADDLSFGSDEARKGYALRLGELTLDAAEALQRKRDKQG